MAKLQLLECHVAIAGDILNVVHRHRFNPVSFPELLVLKYLHGENSITEVFEVGHVDREETEEYARLCQVYDAAMIREKLFPGAAFRLPMADSRYRERTHMPVSAPAAPDLPEPMLTQPPTPAAAAQDTLDALTAAFTPPEHTGGPPTPSPRTAAPPPPVAAVNAHVADKADEPPAAPAKHASTTSRPVPLPERRAAPPSPSTTPA